MAILTLHRDGSVHTFLFSPPRTLSRILEDAGISIPHPCGGRGRCGKCAVRLEGEVSSPNQAEQAAGTRLSCQAVLLGDAAAWLSETAPLEQIEVGEGIAVVPGDPISGRLGAAVDIGTTTVALKLYRLHDGAELSHAACINPQTSVAADVMGRIEAAWTGRLELLRSQILQTLDALIKQACENAHADAAQVNTLVLTGNTTMLYLLTGRDPESLAHAPFRADCLFGITETVLERRAYLPPCMNAFVGADITCAVLRSAMTEEDATVLLCDIGTNGEIALWKGGTLFVTSTAAGPAFEGAGISCGCGSIRGAIDHVWVKNGSLRCHTIGDAPAVGLCGSGLIDAVAALLELECIDETGATSQPAFPLTAGVCLLPKDIRAVQLAKAAIAAGIQTLLESSGTRENEISRFYICGGFGAHLDIESAVAIGLFPASLEEKAVILGNAALAGAAELLLDQSGIQKARQIAGQAVHVNLGGNSTFNNYFIEQMLFPEQEESL